MCLCYISVDLYQVNIEDHLIRSSYYVYIIIIYYSIKIYLKWEYYISNNYSANKQKQ
jgi:hypothetical protein